MDDIERAIWDAWRRIAPTLRNDEPELTRRLARRRSPLLMRPPRAWCLAIRAGDTRISVSSPHSKSSPAAHSVMLDADQLRDLCRPVTIPWPGERSTEVAAMLGREPMGLRDARINGLFQVRHIKGLDGSPGRPVPILYTDRPLDPAARAFTAADPVWAHTADATITRIPDDLFVALQRVPTFRPFASRHHYDEHAHPEVVDAAGVITTSTRRRHQRLPAPEPDHVWYKWSRSGHYLGDDPKNWRKTFQDLGERPPRYLKRHKSKRRRPSTSRGSLWFRGWAWLCPACGKTCRTLYLPLPPLHHFLASEEPHLAQLADIPRTLEGFACRKCHRVKFFSRVQSEAWNDTIAYLTSGLLYGSEVPRPDWFTKDRKRPYKPLLNARPALRREQVEQRLLNGQTRAQIAADLHMTLNAVNLQIWKIYRQHGTRRSQRALLRKHNRPLPPHLLPRREQVRQHIHAGLSQQEIAQKMGITKQAVQSYTSQLYKSGTLPRPKPKRDAVATLHAQGLSPKDIAVATGLTRQNVYDHLHELRESGDLPKLTRITDRETLLRLLLTDLTLRGIGERMGQKLSTIGARAVRIYRAEGVRNRRELLRTWRVGRVNHSISNQLSLRAAQIEKTLGISIQKNRFKEAHEHHSRQSNQEPHYNSLQ